jgi:hypothetical protein
MVIGIDVLQIGEHDVRRLPLERRPAATWCFRCEA